MKLLIDSGKKAELGEKDWAPCASACSECGQPCHTARDRQRADAARVFDNICVIVPLRSSQAQILWSRRWRLRLMWRDDEYTDLKTREPQSASMPGKSQAV